MTTSLRKDGNSHNAPTASTTPTQAFEQAIKAHDKAVAAAVESFLKNIAESSHGLCSLFFRPFPVQQNSLQGLHPLFHPGKPLVDLLNHFRLSCIFCPMAL